jgi:hypothetical protein
MKKNNNKTLKTLLIGGSILAASLIPYNADGQIFPELPKVINPFLSPDATAVAKAYNANNGLSLQDIAFRDNLAATRETNSRTHTIPANPDPLFNCQNWTMIDILTGYDWGEGVYNVGGQKLLFNGYKGWDKALIYANGGTFADQGTLGLPLFRVTFTLSTGEQHTQTALLTGNNALVGLQWNYIEPRDGITKVKPGQLNIPLNCTDFNISYNFVGKTDAHEKVLAICPILEFKIVNGEMTLTYNINDDPIYNDRVHLITQRENDKPIINVKSTSSLDSLVVNIVEANPKNRKLRIDDGAAIDIAQYDKRKMNLPVGTHKIQIFVDDYFNLSSDTVFFRTITNSAPTITFNTPVDGARYDKEIRLKGSITDNENDPITATYSIDGGSPITIGKDFDKPLSLPNGLHKIVIIASDAYHTGANATKDSVNFEMEKANVPNTNLYPNPTEDILHIKYKSGMSGNAFMSIYTSDGKAVMTKKINGAREEDLELSNLNAGTYFLRISDNDTETSHTFIKVQKQ